MPYHRSTSVTKSMICLALIPAGKQRLSFRKQSPYGAVQLGIAPPDMARPPRSAHDAGEPAGCRHKIPV
jgi:hypothetical protein